MDSTSDHSPTIGETIRLARLAARQSQRQLGAKLGYSASAISRLETGKNPPDLDTLRSIANVLHIPPEQLGLAPAHCNPSDTPIAPTTPATLTATDTKDGDDRVHRRRFLAAGAGAAAAVAIGAPAHATPAPPQEISTARLDQVLFTAAPAVAPVAVEQLRAALAVARSDFRAARYATLADQLPHLITLGETSQATSTGTTREAMSAVLADTYSLASEWCVKQNQDPLAWVTADRALRAARASGNPTARGEAARMVAIAMRRVGHYDAAADLLTTTALGLGADHGNPDPNTLAAYGSLLLTASYAAAQGGNRPTALDLAGEAEQTAHRLHDRPVTGLFTPDFTTQQVALYRIGVHLALGDSTGALTHARTVDVARLPSPERQARYCLDVARTYRTLGKPDKVYQALLAAERYAPEDVRRPSVRTVVGELLYAPGSMPGLRTFAHRIGASA
ncbi:helix-turn-helix domain-containing protein [Frankia gtarii]|uniref:helix-turn-helix domain-containing protein n=1 Tax=Frankia gtarii TaxID=2950102 RepID=UPI0021C1084D|nr:helix-turn-helix transcriptional regulator [Frankia gtarii]